MCHAIEVGSPKRNRAKPSQPKKPTSKGSPVPIREENWDILEITVGENKKEIASDDSNPGKKVAVSKKISSQHCNSNLLLCSMVETALQSRRAL